MSESTQTLGDTVSRIGRKRSDAFEPNGGERSFSIIPERCYDKTVPFTSDDETTIRITHPNHDVHQLQDTFIYFEFTVVGTLSTGITSPMFFLGWRDANQMLKTLRVYSNNVQTDYIQRECAKEGFHKSSTMSDEERHCQLFAHTRREDAINYQTGVCGTYITTTTNGGTDFTSSFSVVLPITDIPAFENFKDISAPGLDITLKFSINADSLVTMQVDPGKYEQYTNRYYYTETPIPLSYHFNTLDLMELHDSNDQSVTMGIFITINSLTCTKCQCECYGYNVRPDVRLALAEQAQKPLLIPCSRLEIYNMPDTLTTGSTSYASITHANLEDVKEIDVMLEYNEYYSYPLYPDPYYSSIQLYIDDKPYPIEPYFPESYNPRFVSQFVRARKNKGLINKTTLSELILDDIAGLRARIDFEYRVLFQTKRNRDGMFVWDGLDTEGKKVSLDLRIILSDFLAQDARPELWIIRDTAWLLDINGLKYINHQNHLKTHKELGWLTQAPNQI